MKKYILILAYSLAILTLSHCDSSESEKVNNYVNDDGLIGKVKSTKEIVYIAIDNIGDVIKGNLHSGRYDDNFDKKEMNTYNLYNRQGNRIKKIDFTYFSIDNELDRARMWGRMSKKKWLEKEKGPSTNSQKNDSITILGNDSLINQKRTTNYRYNTQRKLVELDANWLNNKTLYKYDSVGKLIKETTYSFPRSKYSLIDNELILNDTTTSTYSYKYNSKRNISEVNYYYSGELIRIKKYTYSDSSKRLKIREYSKSGDYLGMEDITRDTLGNILKSIDYDSDGVIDFINIYNSKGKLTEYVVGTYIDDETPSWYSKNKGDLYKKKTYEYNSNGYIAETIKSSYFLNNGNIEHTLILEQRNFEYQYDSTGNWINKIIYINHRPKYFIEKEINYFDETNSFNKKKINTKNENSPAKLKIDNGLFPNCYNYKYDKTIDNYLKINIGKGTDVAIKVIKLSDNNCTRFVFINRNTTFKIKNIPEGKYYLKIAYGKDWYAKTGADLCNGKFIHNTLYEKGTDILDFTITRSTNGSQIPIYELSLDVESSNIANSFNSKNISEIEFNK